MARPLSAVIFDMDGLLLDSEPFWQQAERECFAAVGVSLDERDLCRTVGMRIDEVTHYWLARRPWDLDRDPAEAVARAIVERVISLVRERGQPLPGVTAALQAAGDLGLARGLASSSSMRIIRAALATLGIAGEFDVVHSAESEAHGKPHPGVYLTAAAKLGVAPAACLALEDSIAGLESALAAGMRCVMVPDPRLRSRPELSRATRVLASLEQLDLSDWSGR